MSIVELALCCQVKPYKETGTFIIKSPEEASQLLDDHIVMTQTMSFSPYKKPFEERISGWEGKLNMTQVIRFIVKFLIIQMTVNAQYS